MLLGSLIVIVPSTRADFKPWLSIVAEKGILPPGCPPSTDHRCTEKNGVSYGTIIMMGWLIDANAAICAPGGAFSVKESRATFSPGVSNSGIRSFMIALDPSNSTNSIYSSYPGKLSLTLTSGSSFTKLTLIVTSFPGSYAISVLPGATPIAATEAIEQSNTRITSSVIFIFIFYPEEICIMMLNMNIYGVWIFCGKKKKRKKNKSILQILRNM